MKNKNRRSVRTVALMLLAVMGVSTLSGCIVVERHPYYHHWRHW